MILPKIALGTKSQKAARNGRLFPCRLEQKRSTSPSSDLDEEESHIKRRLHRILEDPDRSAIILHAENTSPECVESLIQKFVAGSISSNYNLVIALLECLLEEPGWLDFENWFHRELDRGVFQGRVAWLTLGHSRQSEWSELDGLVSLACHCGSVVVKTGDDDLGALSKSLRVHEFRSAEIDHWLLPEQAASADPKSKSPIAPPSPIGTQLAPF